MTKPDDSFEEIAGVDEIAGLRQMITLKDESPLAGLRQQNPNLKTSSPGGAHDNAGAVPENKAAANRKIEGDAT